MKLSDRISFFELNNPTSEYRAFEEQLYQKLCRKLGLVTEITPHLTQLSAMPVGRLDYYSPSGKVGESIEYSSEADFIAAIKQDNYCGVPMGIVVYSDPVTGKHMDTSWRLELDPPPLGFSVEPCPAQPGQEQVEQETDFDYEYEP